MTKGINNILSILYTFYCSAVIVSVYILLFPIQFIFLQSKKTHHKAHNLNKIVVKISLFFWQIRSEVVGRHFINPNKNYIFVANHASIFDIPAMFTIVPRYGVFVGKSSLSKIPLFGYMYKRLYITVNRKDADSRTKVVEKGLHQLSKGHNVIIFPEGTIPKSAPEMIHFKDGAFQLALETNTPIVPVTFCTNWKIIPDQKIFRIKKHTFVAKIHKPIIVKSDSEKNLKELKQEVYDIINKDLTHYLNNENN